MNLLKMPNKTGDKIYFYYDFARGKEQRPSTGAFIHKKPKNEIRKTKIKRQKKYWRSRKASLQSKQQAIGSVSYPSINSKLTFLNISYIYRRTHGTLL